MNNCFSIYYTSWTTSGPKDNFICENITTKAILFFFGCSEVNSTWLITSELANQRPRKVLFTCVVYTKFQYAQACFHFLVFPFIELWYLLKHMAMNGFLGLMLCIQTLSQRQSCVSVCQDEKTRDRSPRVFIICQVDWVLVIPSCFVGHYCFQRVVVVVY